MNNKKINILSLILLSLVFFSACSKTETNHANIKISISAIHTQEIFSLMSEGTHLTAPHAPADISGFNCLLINVVGPGIGDWDSNKDQVGVGRNFSYIGTHSKLIPVETGGSVQIKVVKGVTRNIQIIGLKSTVGCPDNITAADLNSVTKFPGIFIVGSVEKDIFKDASITIKTNYSVTTTADARGSDAQPVPTNADTTAPSPGNIGLITASGVTTTGATLTWSAATDDATLQNQLQYKLVTASTTALLSTVANADAATTVLDWTSNQLSKVVTGLTPNTAYAYAVLVKDGVGNKALYFAILATTTSNTFSITYNGNNNVSGNVPVDSSVYTAGSTVTVLGNTGTLVKTGFTFNGWNTAADGSGTSYAAAATFAMGSANVTLYARWLAFYTVTYNGNGSTSGAVPTDASTYATSATVTALGNTGTLARAGFIFNGWNTASDGSGTSYAGAATFAMGAANRILYALWSDGRTFYVSTLGSDTTGSGSILMPYRSLGLAVSTAKVSSLTGAFEVRAALGTYALTANLVPHTGTGAAARLISFYGGYSNDFSTRNSISNETIISDTRTNSYYQAMNYQISDAGYNTLSLVIDGFTFQSGTLQSTPTPTGYIGIYVYGGVNVSISNNKLLLDYAYLAGGSGASGWLKGMSLNPAETQSSQIWNIYNNIITIKDTPDTAVTTLGIETPNYYSDTSLTFRVYNNTIYILGRGTSSNTNSAIQFNLRDAPTPTAALNTHEIRNNTFVFVGDATDTVFKPLLYFGNHPRRIKVENNIFYSTSGEGNLIYVPLDGFLSFKNNAFYHNGQATGRSMVYVDNALSHRITAATVNTLVAASGNVKEEPVFFSPAAENWRLSGSTPTTITTGGIDGAAASPAWTFTTDYDGVTRTGSAGSGWSMGAYEY